MAYSEGPPRPPPCPSAPSTTPSPMRCSTESGRMDSRVRRGILVGIAFSLRHEGRVAGLEGE